MSTSVRRDSFDFEMQHYHRPDDLIDDVPEIEVIYDDDHPPPRSKPTTILIHKIPKEKVISDKCAITCAIACSITCVCIPLICVLAAALTPFACYTIDIDPSINAYNEKFKCIDTVVQKGHWRPSNCTFSPHRQPRTACFEATAIPLGLSAICALLVCGFYFCNKACAYFEHKYSRVVTDEIDWCNMATCCCNQYCTKDDFTECLKKFTDHERY